MFFQVRYSVFTFADNNALFHNSSICEGMKLSVGAYRAKGKLPSLNIFNVDVEVYV